MIFSEFRSKPLSAFQIYEKDAATGDVLVPSTVRKSVLHLKPFVCLRAFCAAVYFSFEIIYLPFEIIYLPCKVKLIKTDTS